MSSPSHNDLWLYERIDALEAELAIANNRITTLEAENAKLKGIIETTGAEMNHCTCHERDSSYVCEYCYSQGYRGHMQTKR